MMDQDQQPGSIASLVAKTLQFFRILQDALSKPTTSNDDLKGTNLNDVLLQTENDFTRFRMWVGNQAAHQSGPSSLDYRLREATHLQQQVTYLLEDICESLQTTISLVYDSPSSLERNQQNEIFQDDECSSLGPGEADESDLSDLESYEQPSSGLFTASTDIREAVDCLLHLSVAIANPAPHKRFRKLDTRPSEDNSFYELNGIAYVKDEFPGIANELACALTRFITRRCQFIESRHAHHKSLDSIIALVLSGKDNDTSRTGPIHEDTLSTAGTDGMSQTSYDMPSSDQQPAGSLRMPLRPRAVEDGTLECPLCYKMITAKFSFAWKRHIFEDREHVVGDKQHVLADLRPYTCVFPECIESNLDFDSRHNWQSHTLIYHWRSWSCPFKCRLPPFSTKAELGRHIGEYHLPTGTKEDIGLITDLGERSAPDGISTPCHLCGHSVKNLAEYINHVGCHLESLALFALRSFVKRAKGSEDLDTRNSGQALEKLDSFIRLDFEEEDSKSEAESSEQSSSLLGDRADSTDLIGKVRYHALQLRGKGKEDSTSIKSSPISLAYGSPSPPGIPPRSRIPLPSRTPEERGEEYDEYELPWIPSRRPEQERRPESNASLGSQGRGRSRIFRSTRETF